MRPALPCLLLLLAACGQSGDIVPPGGDPDGGPSAPPDAARPDAMAVIDAAEVPMIDAMPPPPDADLPDAGPEPEDPAAYLFDLFLPQVHGFDVTIAPEDWQWLQDNALLEQYRPCQVTFEDQTVMQAAIRFKGSTGTLKSCFDSMGNQICPKLSIKLKFNEYDPDGRFRGLRRLNFHSAIRDDSFMHEVVAYHLFRSMGLPAPRASHATLRVNGEPQGLFVLVEDLDKEFIQDHWGAADEGNLYKAVWPQHATSGPYRLALETNEEMGDVSRMITLYETISTATPASFETDVAGQLDLPQLARYLAVDRAARHIDSIRTFRCFDPEQTAQECVNGNYYWYEIPGGPTELVAWDTDLTFQRVDRDLGRSYFEPDPWGCEPTPYCVYFNHPDCVPEQEDVFILSPQCNTFYGHLHRATWDDYLDALQELATGAMSPPQLQPLMNTVRSRIAAAVMADTHGPGLARWDDANDSLDAIINAQLDEIDILLAEQSP